ncbi:MAG: hypothetical protein OXI24_18430 [Candidatus Poribacteria bacterium]|nr:hypothetical protein [Candidatus Poribacteria bacterium]
MKIQCNLKVMSWTFVLTVLFCAGIFLYTQWDLRQFETSLGEIPTPRNFQKVVSEREIITHEHDDYAAPAGTVDLKHFKEKVLEVDVPEMEMPAVLPVETDMSLMEYDLQELSLSEVELVDVPVEGVGWTQSKMAGRDYNDFIEIDPEYAYARLADGFREMYGDHPEIDVIVETIKRANQQTMRVDDAIQMAEAFLRIMPEEAAGSIDMLSTQLEMLRELKALELYGEKVEIRYDIEVGE